MGRGGRRYRGFSLMEALAVSVLMTLLLAVIYPLVQTGWRHWHHTGVETELRDAVNLVMGAVEKDLMRAASTPGREAVDVSDRRLSVVTAWSENASASGAVPERVVVYTIEQDGSSGLTHIYRYVGPPSGAGPGMRLAAEDVDFTGSSFQRQNRRRVLVQLQAQKQRHSLQTVSSYRYGFGSLPLAAARLDHRPGAADGAVG